MSNLWGVKTNRHPNCDGSPWGWVEGSGLHITWSGEAEKRQAKILVDEHNDLLRRIGALEAELVTARQQIEDLRNMPAGDAQIQRIRAELAAVKAERDAVQSWAASMRHAIRALPRPSYGASGVATVEERGYDNSWLNASAVASPPAEASSLANVRTINEMSAEVARLRAALESAPDFELQAYVEWFRGPRAEALAPQKATEVDTVIDDSEVGDV